MQENIKNEVMNEIANLLEMMGDTSLDNVEMVLGPISGTDQC